MIKRNAFLLPTSVGLVFLSGLLLAGCAEKPNAGASPCVAEAASPCVAEAASPAAPADGKMGPPAPPPHAATQGGAPEPFKGTGKVVSDPSGLKYEDMTVGKGVKPKDGQYVQVDYVGTGEDGQIFDESYKRGKAFEFQLGAGRVIKGWDLGVAMMNIGGRRKIIIPGNLAYGENPPGPPIKPNETLTFDIVLHGATDQPTMGGM